MCALSVPGRGNSKYHYYGLRIKAGSSLLRLMEDQQHLAMRQQPFSQKQRCTAHQPMSQLKPIQTNLSVLLAVESFSSTAKSQTLKKHKKNIEFVLFCYNCFSLSALTEVVEV